MNGMGISGNVPSKEEKRSRMHSGTYNVWMDFKYSNVPLASDCKLLSYSDSKLRLCKSRNASRRMHSISLAFSSSSCSEFSPLKTPLGRSLILLPYSTLWIVEEEGLRSIFTCTNDQMGKYLQRGQ